MTEPTITFILSDKTYSLSASNAAAIRDIPSEDRQHLITLLEAVKQQDAIGKAAVQQALDKTTAYPQPTAANPNPANQPTPKAERLGNGDVDALMNRLIMEEKRDARPGLTKQGIYIVFAGFAAVIILLLLIL